MSASRRVETDSPISPDPSLFYTGFLDSSEYSVQALMVSVALYCLLCIILQQQYYYGCPA